VLICKRKLVYKQPFKCTVSQEKRLISCLQPILSILDSKKKKKHLLSCNQCRAEVMMQPVSHYKTDVMVQIVLLWGGGGGGGGGNVPNNLLTK
jgi:transcription elongation factor Elf1